MKAIQTGETAPDFNVLDQNRERVFLAKTAQKGKVLLAFYPVDDTPVCSTQLADYDKHIEEFQKRGVQLFGISISTNESQHKFAQKLGGHLRLLADYDSRVTTKYGVMSFTGHPKRALFLIDENCKVIWQQVEKAAISHRSAEEVLAKLDEIIPPPVPTPEEKTAETPTVDS